MMCVATSYRLGASRGIVAPFCPFPPVDAERIVSYKNLLQEYLQKSRSPSLPSYRTEREPDGYICCLSVKLPPEGKSRTFRGKPHANKKAAEQESAKKACLDLGIVKQ